MTLAGVFGEELVQLMLMSLMMLAELVVLA